MIVAKETNAAQALPRDDVGAVLVCGAGITGIQSALDLASSGFKVYLLDPSPAIGGRMAQLDKTFPTGDCSMCILSPKLVECARNRNIEILSMSEVTGLAGEPGRFQVSVRKHPRYVDEDKCNACGECAEVCPVRLPSEFDSQFGTRTAIYRPYPQAIPNVFTISKARGTAPCKSACPAGVNAQGYVALIGQGKFREAYEVIRQRCAFPAVCGRICQHPCEGQCNRLEIDQPLAVRDLKRFVADHVYENREEYEGLFNPGPVEQTRDQKVAVIGAGPAGLTAAADLAAEGYPVTVMESRSFLGGMLRLGVPAFRLPRDVLDYEIDLLTKHELIDVKTGVKLGRDVTLDGLRSDQGYDAVLIATGAHKSRTMDLAGGEAEGVVYGLDFLGRVNLGEDVPVGKRVVVIGGGNVAMDAARAALRLGAESVTVAYRRGREEMPALPDEISQAEEEGVAFELLAGPIGVKAEAGQAVALECLRMQLGEPDDSGRRRPEPVEGSNFDIPAETIIIAIGQEVDAEGIDLAEWGKIPARADLSTSTPGVFAAGDAVLGPASLVEAMGHGHQAAETVLAYLKRRAAGETAEAIAADSEQASGRAEDEAVAPNPQPKAPSQARHEMPVAPLADRLLNFSEIEHGYTAEQAVAEASRCLACGLCSECGQCATVCEPGAIDYDMKPVDVTLNVGSIILTPGYDAFQAAQRGEFGHERYGNVLSSVQFERMLSAAGPTSGKVMRPSDGKEVKRIAFLQCVGSRDSKCGAGYCSSICCMSATKEAMVALEHTPGLEVSIFCMDIRAFGKEFDAYVNRAREAHGVEFIRAIPSRVIEMPDTRTPRVKYFDAEGQQQTRDFDLVVLSVGMRPGADVRRLADDLGVELNTFGFAQTDRLSPMTTSRPGIYVAGAFQEPKDIPESVAQASGAAARAMGQLASVRGDLVAKHEYPWERDVADEAPRIGVFICHCGHNIASVIDVDKVAAAALALPNVVHAEANLYTCSDTSQQLIQDLVHAKRLNRLVVASCSPRTHEALFQETLRESGLNPYLFAMTNIRDQCSWVHRDDPERATTKAIDLMTMAVARARLLQQLQTGRLEVTQSALILGGGLAGLTCGLALADQGFAVHLVEKEDQLGGNLRHVKTTLEGGDVQEYLADLIRRAESHEKVTVHRATRLANISGHVGHFVSRLAPVDSEGDGDEETVNHGVVILATGGAQRETELYLYGQDPRIVTQRELEAQLADAGGLPADLGDAPTVVMIQCVGSRNEENPYCSRVCCSEAVKNALHIKQTNPEAQVVVLAKDIRTYGFRETYFQQAREAGVLFIRHPEDADPEVALDGTTLSVRVTDAGTGREVSLQPDLLALSVGIAPAEDNPVLSGMLRTALTSDGFFLEAHPKLRPVDLANEGEYLAGLAHSPRFIDETIAHAMGAAGRAATVLSQTHLTIPGQVAHVDPTHCVACATCVKVCPYGAPRINELHKAEIQGAMCMGCGSCSAACPARAITLRHQADRQFEAMLDELLVHEGK